MHLGVSTKRGSPVENYADYSKGKFYPPAPLLNFIFNQCQSYQKVGNNQFLYRKLSPFQPMLAVSFFTVTFFSHSLRRHTY